MSTLLAHSGYLTGRALRALWRQPVYVAFTLVQPMIWLLLFGQLFKSVSELPGFGGTSYIDFLTPGVVVMTALFASAWSGMGFIEDMERGVMDRLLVSPVRRGAMMTGSLVYQAAVTVLQSLIVLAVGVAVGARYPGGAVGVAVTVGSAVLLATAFGSISNALALTMRTQETVIAVAQFFTLPLSFLSSVIMVPELAPEWIQTVARYNPVNWAVLASREALSATPDWGSVARHLGLLAGVALVCAWLATQAFRTYQHST